jgi:hypothetical protein
MTAADLAPIVFLDIDGVLNCHESDPEALCGQIHKDKVDRLNRILRETGAMIVLSSAWRYLVHRGEMNEAGMDWLLRSHGVIAERLAGITEADSMIPNGGAYNGKPCDWPVENERGRQITRWLDAHGRRPYVVLDDMDLGITEAAHPFVDTFPDVGLTDALAGLAIKILTESAR